MMAALNVNLSTDMEVVQTLLEKYSQRPDSDEKLTLLEDLEFYSHQVS